MISTIYSTVLSVHRPYPSWPLGFAVLEISTYVLQDQKKMSRALRAILYCTQKLHELAHIFWSTMTEKTALLNNQTYLEKSKKKTL